MKNYQIVKIFLIVLVCVVLDIILHIVTSSYSTMPDNPNFSLVAIVLGVEITAFLWALFAFSGVSFVYWEIRNEISGGGIKKGLRYGIAIALLWLFGMLEGVSLFNHPFIKEFVVGLSDAIPVLVLSVLLSTLRNEKCESDFTATFIGRQKIKIVLIFTVTFLTGRYIAYFSGVIQSGNQIRAVQTFIWTLLMGVSIGIAFVLLGKSKNVQSLKYKSIKFGFLIFGLNWALFLVFMPLLFSGYIGDVFLRIIIDTTLVTIASYLAIAPNGMFLFKKIVAKHRILQESVNK